MKNLLSKLVFILLTAVAVVSSMSVMIYAETEGGGSPLGTMGPTLIYFAFLIGAFYFFLIRPQKKRMRNEESMRNTIVLGDEVVMTSGIIGKVINIKDDEVTIETGAARTQIKFTKQAIGRITKKLDEVEGEKSSEDKKAELQKKLDEKKSSKNVDKME